MNNRLLGIIAVVLLLLAVPLVAQAQSGCGCLPDPTIDVVNIDFACDRLTISWSHSPGTATLLLVGEVLTSDLIALEIYPNPSGSFTASFNPPLGGNSQVVVLLAIADEEFDEDTGLPTGGGDIVALGAYLLTDCDQGGTASPACADGRLNSRWCDQLAVYPEVTEDGIGLTIYTLTRGSDEGQFSMYLPEDVFEALPDSVEANCTISQSQDGRVVVYMLTTGEIQINVGPDEEGKVFEYIFPNLMSSPTSVDTYVSGMKPDILPPCV